MTPQPRARSASIYKRTKDGSGVSSPYIHHLQSFLLFTFAFVARLGAIGRYITPDELDWVRWSINFRQALLTGDWANTIQTGHPGVVTTWLGAIGVQLTLWFSPSSAADLDFAQRLAWTPTISAEAHNHLATFLTGGRIMVVLATSAGIWLIYRLLAQRFSPTVAFFGAAFLALDPWSAGLSGLLNLDALLGTCILLTLLLAFGNNLTNGRLFFAGVLTAAAILTKLPGLILLPLVPIFLTGQLYFDQKLTLATLFKQLTLWLVGLGLTSLILLPALAHSPIETVNFITEIGLKETGIRTPLFFMGQATNRLPSYFYPLAVLIRQSPLVTVGLVLTGWQVISGKWKVTSEKRVFGAVLVVFCLLFWLGIGVSTRSFTRYALPISQVLTLVGGMGLAKFASTLTPSLSPKLGRKEFAQTFLIGILVLQIGWMGWFWRFPLSTANLLTGGPSASVNQVALGWGDGVGQAIRFAANEPNASQRRLFTTNIPAAASFYPGEVLRLTDATVNLIRPDDFVVMALGEKQATPGRWFPSDPNAGWPLAQRFPADLDPIHTVHFNQLDRAWLYTNFPADMLSQTETITGDPFRFGGDLQLIDSTVFVPENRFQLVAQMTFMAGGPADYRLLLTVEDGAGNVWTQREEPLVANSGLPLSAWQADTAESLFLTIPFPADMPPDFYTLSVEIFDANGGRVGVFGQDGSFRGVAAPLGRFQSPLPTSPLDVAVQNGDALTPPLAGFIPPPNAVGQGETLAFDLWWRHASGQSGDVLLLKIGEEILPYPFGMPNWRPNDVYRLKPSWQVPADFSPGDYPLAIGRAGDGGQTFQPLGMLTVEQRDREFSTPEIANDALVVQFGTIAMLMHADVTVGDAINVDLIWQGNRPNGIDLTMFIHLKDADGNIIEQIDRPPVKPVSLWLSNEIVRDSVTLNRPDETVQIAIGLYDPNSGQRLAVRSLDGRVLADGQYVIPLNK